MKNLAIISGHMPQYQGCLHMHTNRSPDCQCPYADALAEYRGKGFDFCVMTDHEVYWNSDALDRPDFLVLSGAESAFLPNGDYRFLLDRRLEKHCHLNLIWDVTAGPCGFSHDEALPRPVDWGISSWNRVIRQYREKNQLVIFNHPNWSHTDFEVFLAAEGCFAFEIWNSGSVKDVGGYPDDAIWDYALERGKRIWAVAGDDTHHYGESADVCGACATMVLADEFSNAGLTAALRNGQFYPTTGPRIREMRIEDGVLCMAFSPASLVQICGGGGFGRSFYARGAALEALRWPVNTKLKYFRVRITDEHGNTAWSQPVFMEDLID